MKDDNAFSFGENHEIPTERH